MEILVDISRQRLRRAFAAVARQKTLQEAEGAAWPLPPEIAVHLLLLQLGLSLS